MPGGVVAYRDLSAAGAVDEAMRNLFAYPARERNDPTSGLASPNRTAYLSGRVLGWIDASNSESRLNS